MNYTKPKYYCVHCLNEVSIYANVSFNQKTGEIKNCCKTCGESGIITDWKKRSTQRERRINEILE